MEALCELMATRGMVVTSVGNAGDEQMDIAVQSDGKLVAAGYSVDDSRQVHFAVVR